MSIVIPKLSNNREFTDPIHTRRSGCSNFASPCCSCSKPGLHRIIVIAIKET